MLGEMCVLNVEGCAVFSVPSEYVSLGAIALLWYLGGCSVILINHPFLF